MPAPSPRDIHLAVVNADALQFPADVLAVKYAQAPYGLDLAVIRALGSPPLRLPDDSHGLFLSTEGRLAATAVLIVGTKPLGAFGYPEVRDFSRRVLETLVTAAPATAHLALTLHGAGYGLDEREAFESEIAGLSDAIVSGRFPRALQRISVVERNPGRAGRLEVWLERLTPSGLLSVRPERAPAEALQSAGLASPPKPSIFVAMPFDPAMDDTFHYGIQNAVHAAGYLCERADQSTFTGDILDWMKRRIAAARLVIADLTGANPNVYLEVGYAWGLGKPTVLTVRDTGDLKFDVRGQRCLTYSSIRDLEERLRRELQSLLQMQ
ncbi:MAG: hypothetical protein SFV54_25830 [Bryobacteraceae bacterium]|nr:hypothetical protein [Bryobacteraceae bacterium]